MALRKEIPHLLMAMATDDEDSVNNRVVENEAELSFEERRIPEKRGKVEAGD